MRAALLREASALPLPRQESKLLPSFQAASGNGVFPSAPDPAVPPRSHIPGGAQGNGQNTPRLAPSAGGPLL